MSSEQASDEGGARKQGETLQSIIFVVVVAADIVVLAVAVIIRRLACVTQITRCDESLLLRASIPWLEERQFIIVITPAPTTNDTLPLHTRRVAHPYIHSMIRDTPSAWTGR